MRPPRRIFRSTMAARSSRAGRALLAWTLAAAGTAALVMVGLSSDLFGRAPPGPERLLAEPGQVAVVDGDTLRLAGQVVRLDGVQAPSRGDTCRSGADCGGAATSALAGLVRDRKVECRLSGHDRLGRPYAACAANGRDLSSAIVASGWARASEARPALADLELRARQQGAGLWADVLRR